MSVIAIDVDQTVVDVCTGWFKWLTQIWGIDVKGVADDYKVAKYFDLLAKHGSFRSMDYWKNDRLYDNLEPIDESVYSVALLKAMGHEVIFVSSCIDEYQHIGSKARFIEKHFPTCPFIVTSAKGYVNYDIMIDDTVSVLEKAQSRNPSKQHILFTGTFPVIAEVMTEKGVADYLYGHRLTMRNGWESIVSVIEQNTIKA